MTEPVPSYNGVSWWGNFGEYGFLTKLRSEQLRDFGPSLSPQAAFYLLQGVETLPQRMDAHLANAKQIVNWLVEDERIAYVNYAGLEDHPHHERAKKLLPLGVGSVFSFGVKATEKASGRLVGGEFIGALQLASHLANIGDARTLVLHPGSTTHQQLTAEQLKAGGVGEDLIRISVGLEDVEDIIWDLDQALTYATGLNHAGERVGESSADKIVEAEEAVAAAKAAEDAAAAEAAAGASCSLPTTTQEEK